MNNNPTFKNVHKRFRLNGNPYRFDDLFEIAYSFIKEGEEHERAIGDFLMDWIKPSPFIELKTSGSTGTPKTITYNKQSMVNSALATGNHFNVTIGDTALHCLNADFIAGKMMLVRAMILGLEIDLVPPQGNVLGHSDKPYDFVAMVPLQVEQSFAALDRVKTLLIGGAPTPSTLKNKLATTKVNCFETYGMTETLTHIASRKLNHSSGVYTPLPGVELSTDKRDCLVIEVPYLSDQKIVTNDLVTLAKNKTFQLHGRIDNVINTGGLKVLPEELEAIISETINDPFFIAGIQDDAYGEKLILVVEGTPNPSLKQKLMQLKTIAKYQRPKAVYFLPEFVRTPNGKIQRQLTLSQLNL